ncbi:MAG: AI-2E family transporter [Candidatus Altiarchaeota archaeon]|nr:AI-2E family transporter [Candidatus Altiarchaeota archaeon]
MIRELSLGIVLLVFAKPLLAPIAYASVLAVILFPIYQKHPKKYFGLFLILLSISGLVYLSYILTNTLFGQIQALAGFYSQLSPETQIQLVEIGSNLPLQDYAISVARALPSIVVNLVFFILFSYFFLVDGELIKKAILAYIPRKKAKKLIDEGWHNLRSVVAGVFFAMFVYIICSTALLNFTNSPSPLIYSVIAALFGILPIMGAWMVYGFLIYFHLAAGNFASAMALIAFQLFWNLVVDNYFKMKYRGTLHPAILLGSIASGIAYFGFSGLLIGPLIATGIKTLASAESYVVSPVQVITKTAKGGE